ncbi:phosphoglycerate dehydrogenase [Edaphobacillus lindanitolerans]|uniref:D-3-phosphoglycerate dehydrogenase n=1 Tax=Edaphobacillus lindanitolerans TaxID=550447 RepID=A0A1U7PID2_9BACI|nr:phosphoglycerate dehydrogenase [Edaphobacillus lindanitolerans]SIT73116.1 D-3-phosphoglycerate dehydrogenase [Edaphobacillus lindanitolerans]
MDKVLITPKSFHKYKEEPLRMLEAEGYEVILNTSGKTYSEEELIEMAHSGVKGIIVGVDPLSADVLDACTDLKAVSKYGVGMDNIDLERAKARGIHVKNAVGTNSISVAELAIGLMFDSARLLSAHIERVKASNWDRVMGIELTGKHLAVIGGGQIGKEVAMRAKGLQMQVTLYDPFFKDTQFLDEYGIARSEDFLSLVADADFITLHLPATKETRHMMNAEVFAKMKPTAILINTARGELVDEPALYEALVNGEIGAAAQDVYSKEPPEEDDPLVALPNFLLTPHLGAFTGEAVERMAVTSTRNLLEMLKERNDA